MRMVADVAMPKGKEMYRNSSSVMTAVCASSCTVPVLAAAQARQRRAGRCRSPSPVSLTPCPLNVILFGYALVCQQESCTSVGNAPEVSP